MLLSAPQLIIWMSLWPGGGSSALGRAGPLLGPTGAGDPKKGTLLSGHSVAGQRGLPGGGEVSAGCQ